MNEPQLSHLPPPPEDLKDFAQWARNLAELSDQRASAERAQGLREGREVGRHEGELLGEAKALLLVLRSRGLHVSLELEQRILACGDPAVLATWLQRAATLTNAEELLAG